MFKQISLILSAVVASCSTSSEFTSGNAIPQPDLSAPAVSSNQSLGRADQGQNGLVGEVYRLQQHTLQTPVTFKEDFVLEKIGSIVSPNLDVPTRRFDEGFPGVGNNGRAIYEWFAIRYEGKIFIEESGVYEFQSTSDDGSMVYLNRKLVVDNGSAHPTQSRQGKVFLPAGWNKINVHYFQGPAYEIALQLSWKRPWESQFSIITSQYFNR